MPRKKTPKTRFQEENAQKRRSQDGVYLPIFPEPAATGEILMVLINSRQRLIVFIGSLETIDFKAAKRQRHGGGGVGRGYSDTPHMTSMEDPFGFAR